MNRHLLTVFLLFFSTSFSFAQWLPSIEKTQTAVGDILVTNNGRIILNNLEQYTPDGTTYLKYSDDNGKTWRNVKGVTLPDYTSLGVLGKQGSSLFAYSTVGIWKSRDNGQTWTLKPMAQGSTSFMRKFVANDKFIVFANDNSGLLFSQDQGETWKSGGVPTSYISGIDLRGDTLFVSAQYDVYQGVFRNNDWEWKKSSIANSGYVYDFSGIAAPDAKTIVVTALSNAGLFISRDGGATWENPAVINAQGTGERSFDDIYIFDNYWVLTSNKYVGKIFVSTDKGKTWKDFTSGLPKPIATNTLIREVPFNKVNIQNGVLFAAIGYSLWMRPISELASGYLESPTFLKANITKRNTNLIEWLDNSLEETGFIIERAENSALNFKEIARLPKNTVTFTDYDLPGGNTYYYRIKSFNSTIASQYSEILKVERPPNICKVTKKAVYSFGMSSLAFITDKIGYAFRGNGNGQTLMKSEDGGSTWKDIELNSIQNYSTIYFSDSKTGILLGSYMDTLMTNDGGLTWRKIQQKYPPTKKQYQQFRKSLPFFEFYINDSTGFRGGTSLARTGDYGKSWISLKTDISVGKIYFTDTKTGFFYEPSGRVGATANGGDTWTYLTLPVKFSQLKDMYTTDGKTLFFAGNTNSDNDPVIIKTKDNGKTFESFKVNLLSTAGGIANISAVGLKTWIITTNKEIYLSEDDLKTWKLLSIPPSIYRSSITFKNNWGLVGAETYSTNKYNLTVFMTYDGGRTWQDIKLPSKSVNVFGAKVKIFDDNKAAVLSEDIVYKTNDRGKTWSTTNIPFMQSGSSTNGFIYNYHFVSENVWYMNHRFFGEEYKLYKTTDGGKNWQYLPQVKNPYNVLYFFNENFGFVQGNGTGFYRTTDGGNSWTRIDTSLPNFFTATNVFFLNANRGFLTGGSINTTLMETTDGGISWNKVVLDKSLENLGTATEIKFFNSQIGYVKAGRVIKTVDGGKTWTETTLEDILSQYASLANFDDYYLDEGYNNQLFHYEPSKPSAKPHEPNGGIDACLFRAATTYEVDNNDSYSYQWKLSGGGILTPNRNEALIKWNTLGTYKLSVKTINDCGESDWQETSITVRALANKPALTSGDLNPCPNNNITYKVNPSNNYTYQWFFTPQVSNNNSNKNEVVAYFNQENKNFTINVIAKDTYCPSDTLSFDVKTKQLPSIPTITVKNNILVSSSLVNNQWLFEGKPLADSTKQSLVPNQGTGNYSVKVSNECGFNISRPVFIIISAIESESDNKVSVYPNPAHDYISVYTQEHPIKQLLLYNIYGQIVKKNAPDNKDKIAVSDLNSGIYLLKIHLDNQTITHKIVIEK